MSAIKPFFFFAFFLIIHQTSGQKKPDFLIDYNAKWVDSVFLTMSIDEKIGQLLMPRGNYSGKPHDVRQLEEWVTKYKIGGIVFFAGPPTTQVDLTNSLQKLSNIPLWIGQDFEWGTAMRLDSTVQFPYAMTLGAISESNDWITKMGEELGKHCRRLGVHINYAPVVDVNSNPENPVINFRSFGGDKFNVSNKGLDFYRGLNNQRIIATAKHFPGHGDTKTDSHVDLPVVLATKTQLEQEDLYPFSKLIEAGIPGIMSAHLHVPALDDTPNMPSTLSRKTIHDLLRIQMGFDGLVFTDAMDMQGVLKHQSQGEAIISALIAGNDIIETFLDVPAAVEAIKKALQDDRLTSAWLDFKVKKILKAKSWVGLDRYTPIERNQLVKDLNNIQSDMVNEVLAAKALTLLKNDNQVIPISVKNDKALCINLNDSDDSPTTAMLKNHGDIRTISFPLSQINRSHIEALQTEINKAEIVLVAAHLDNMRPAKQYGLTPDYLDVLAYLSKQNNTVLLWLGNPYGLDKFDWSGYQALACGYQNDEYCQKNIIQAVFGGLSLNGEMPVRLKKANLQSGLKLSKTKELSYGKGLLTDGQYQSLHETIDSMMDFALKESLFPGATVQVIHKNNVVIQKAYGYPTYYHQQIGNEFIETQKVNNAMDVVTSGSQNNVRKLQIEDKVNIHDFYDIASLTKIAGSALAFMRWQDEGKISVDDKLGKHFPEWSHLPIGSRTFKDFLTHRSGLPAWIPFWRTTIDSTASLNNALQRISGLDSLCVYDVKKPFFLWRWFGKKSTKKLSVEKTIEARNPAVWNQIFKDDLNLVWNKKYYSKVKTPDYSIQIRDSLWLIQSYEKEIFRQILESPLKPPGTYVYSDLHFYFYPELCRRLTGKSLDSYLDSLYKEMGLDFIGFNPTKKIPLDRIIPTERDTFFRQTLIHGIVHDEGAVMMQGVSGHAGLFSNINDVSRLLNMYLNMGKLGLSNWIKKETIQEFTKYQFPEENNRRALFFDKKDPAGKLNNAPSLASNVSYGHSGFTGTYAWVDPQYDLVIVFLSNRVHPSRENGKINQYLFRQRLCDAVYTSLNLTE